MKTFRHSNIFLLHKSLNLIAAPICFFVFNGLDISHINWSSSSTRIFNGAFLFFFVAGGLSVLRALQSRFTVTQNSVISKTLYSNIQMNMNEITSIKGVPFSDAVQISDINGQTLTVDERIHHHHELATLIMGNALNASVLKNKSGFFNNQGILDFISKASISLQE